MWNDLFILAGCLCIPVFDMTNVSTLVNTSNGDLWTNVNGMWPDCDGY